MKKLIAASICSALIINSSLFTVGAEAKVQNSSNTSTHVEEYNPFAEDVEKDDSTLSMSEKLAKIQKEEQQKANGITIDGVLPGHVYIPKKTMLKVELTHDITSKTAQKNQNVEIKLVDNLIVNNVVVIPKGTLGQAYVYDVRKAGGFGRGGKLEIAGREIKTINNISVPLKQGITGKGESDGGAVAVAAAVSILGGAFMKGKNIEYPAGTTFDVEVRENVDLQTDSEGLQNAMNPNTPHGTIITIDEK